MTILLSVVVGGVFAAAVYILLQRNTARLLLGLVLMGHAVNLLIFTAGGLSAAAHPPLIPPEQDQIPQPAANPLPQALILTAIVIGLAVQAFVLVLVRRVVDSAGAADVDALRASET